MLKGARLADAPGALFFDEPDILTYRNAIYQYSSGYFDGASGIFSREGYLIPQAASFHHYPAETKNQPLWVDPRPARYYPTIDRAIFCGEISNQYGHFIVEFLARLWAVAKIRRPGDKLLIHSYMGFQTICTYPWVQAIFACLGLGPEDFMLPDGPCVIRELIVPGPGFAEQGHVSRVFAEFCHGIGDRAMKTLGDAAMTGQNIYLTRSGLVCGTIKIDNEAAFDAALRDRGFLILRPENLSFAEQVSLFRRDNVPVGIVGSAFHNSIFTPDPIGVGINMKAAVDANFTMIDGVNGAGIDYVESDLVQDSAERDHNYYETRTITDIAALADQIAAHVAMRRSTLCVPNMGRVPLCLPIGVKFFNIRHYHGDLLRHEAGTHRVIGTSAEGSDDLLAMSLPDDAMPNRLYLFAPSGRTMRLDGAGQSDMLRPLNAHVQANGSVALQEPRNGLYLSVMPAERGGGVIAHSHNVAEWECFRLEERHDVAIDRASNVHAVIAQLRMRTSRAPAGNPDFYEAMFPHASALADRLACGLG